MPGTNDIDAKIKVAAVVQELDSKKAQEQFEKEVSKLLSKIELGLDDKSVAQQASKIAQKFGAAFSIELKNSLDKIVGNYMFNKQGARIYNRPNVIKGDEGRRVSSAGMQTAKISPDRSNEGRGTRLSISDSDFNKVLDTLRSLGASPEVIAKAIDQGFAKIISAIEYDKSKGEFYAAGNVNESAISFKGKGHLEGDTIVADDIDLASIETIMTNISKAYEQRAQQAERLLKYEEQIKLKLEGSLVEAEQLNKPSEETLSILKQIFECRTRIKRLTEDTKRLDEKGTESQKKKKDFADQIRETQKASKEAAETEKNLSKEQKDIFEDSKRLLKDINTLEKQNIDFRGKANEGEVLAKNEQALEVKRQQLELNKAMLNDEQLQALKKQEQTNQLNQQLLLQQKIYKLRSTKNSQGNFLDEVHTALGRVATYGVAYNLINALKNKIKDTVNIVIKFDKAMTNLSIVTQKNSSEVKKLSQSYVELAKELGTTTEKVFEASDLWLRQGRSIAETNDLIRATMIMANVAQIDSAKSADILTSAINGFKLEAKDAMHIVDVFAAVDLAAAANTEELAEAMQRVAATAGEVGISFENITAYIGTLVDATRLDSGTIGSALNTILSRMQNIKLGNLVGEEESLSDVQKALAQVGIKLFDVNGSFRNMDEVLGEIASKWTQLNDVEKSSIAYAVAGTRQRNLFLQLMNNWDKTLYLSTVALNSENKAMDKQGIYIESLEAKMNRLSAAWDKFTTKGTDASLFKGMADAGNVLLEVLNALRLNLSSFLGLAGGVVLSNISFKGLGSSSFVNKIKEGFNNTFRYPIGSLFAGKDLKQQDSIVAALERETAGFSSKVKEVTTGIAKLGKTESKFASEREALYLREGLTAEESQQAENALNAARQSTTSSTYAAAKAEATEAEKRYQRAFEIDPTSMETAYYEKQWKSARRLQRKRGLGKVVGAAGTALAVGSIVQSLTSSLAGALKSWVSPNTFDKIKSSVEEISKGIEKGTGIENKESLEMLEKVVTQTNEGAEFTQEMQEQLKTVIETLQANLGTTKSLLTVGKEGNVTLANVTDLMNQYYDLAATQPLLSDKTQGKLKELASLSGTGFSVYGKSFDTASFLGDLAGGVSGGAAAGSVIGGGPIGAVIGGIVGAAGPAIKAALGGYDIAGEIGTAKTIEEAISKTKENIADASNAKIKAELNSYLEDLEGVKEKIDSIIGSAREEYASNLSFRARKQAGGRLTNVDKGMINSILSVVTSELSVEQLTDKRVGQELDDLTKDIVNERLKQGASYTDFASLFQEGGKFYTLLKELGVSSVQIESIISMAMPSLAKSAAALKESVSKIKEQYDRAVKAGSARGAMLNSLADMGFALDMSAQDVSKMLNLGGNINTARILDPAYKEYAEDLNELYEKYWGENGRIANASYLEDQQQLNEEYERAVALKQKEYEILQKQLEIQEAQNKLSQAQRERDTLVFRNGRFMYEANPSTIQNLTKEQEDKQRAIEQLQVQADIEKHTNDILSNASAMASALGKIQEQLGNIEGGMAEQAFIDMITADLGDTKQTAEALEKDGKIENKFLDEFFKNMFATLPKDEREKIWDWLGLKEEYVQKLKGQYAYDSGGLLQGQGYFRKDSIGDEVVLSPTDAPKVLSLLSNTSQFTETVNNADKLLRSIVMRGGEATSLFNGFDGGNTIYNVQNVNVEEASDIESILDSAQRQINMVNPKYIRR